MLTDIIPEIINEPVEAGCAPGNKTIGYLAGEISRFRSELKYIADAVPDEWMHEISFIYGHRIEQSLHWAQNCDEVYFRSNPHDFASLV